MTSSDLYDGLVATGYPVAYRQFRSAQNPPFVCYLSNGPSADLMADNTNYVPIRDYRVELYTQNKDPTAEAVIEAALVGLGLTYTKDESYIEDEAMLLVFYEVRLVEAEAAAVS